jgi:hypothetical protein
MDPELIESTAVEPVEPQDAPEIELSLREQIESGLEEARQRDEQGRFTAAEKAQARANVAAKVHKEAPVAPEDVPFPASLKKELQDKWGTLPPDVRKAWAEREAEVHKGFTKHDEERVFGKQLRDVITPYEAIIRAEGGTPASAVQSLLNTAYVLRTGTPTQKTELFKQLAMTYQVPIAELFREVQNQPQIHPAIASLEQQIAQLKQEREAEVAQRQQQEVQQIHGTIDQFKAEPGHEHFDQVKYAMGVMIQNGLADGLQDAYDKAVYADPQLRSTLIQSQTGEAKRAAETAARVAAARKAGSSVSGSPGYGTPGTTVPDRSLREELMAQLENARAQ